MIEAKTPIFFKKLPQTEKTPPNAVYLRLIGSIPGTEVHEILYNQERWKVGTHQIWTVEEGLRARAAQLKAEIDPLRAGFAKLEDVAAKLKISEGTLRKRLKLIQNHGG